MKAKLLTSAALAAIFGLAALAHATDVTASGPATAQRLEGGLFSTAAANKKPLHFSIKGVSTDDDSEGEGENDDGPGHNGADGEHDNGDDA